jgi:AAA domain
MASLPAARTEGGHVRLNTSGEAAALIILSKWKGDHVADACIAATQIGLLHSGGLLSYNRAKDILKSNCDVRSVDEVNWSVVNEAFQNGRSAVISTAELKKRYPPVPANDNDRFQVTWFDEVNQSTAKEELVQGVLGAGEFSLFVAKPGTAKSVLLCDIGCHIAAGRDWHGRKVKQGLVIFFAAERKRVTERRVAAWRKKYGVANIPFAVVGGKLDMTSGLVDAKALAKAIQQAETMSGHPCVLVILDTVTRTFGPGDQHQSRDMQRFVNSVDELTRATGCHVAAIHHSGWENDRGKGAIDLDGAIDASFLVDVKGTGPNKVFSLTCTGANDADDGLITGFRLESVPLGVDADGNETTAPVVVPAKVTPDDGSNLRSNADKVLDALRAVIEVGEQSLPADAPALPDGILAAPRHAWRNRFLLDAAKREPEGKSETLDRIFRRGVADLTKGEKVRSAGDWFWPDNEPDMSGQ